MTPIDFLINKFQIPLDNSKKSIRKIYEGNRISHNSGSREDKEGLKKACSEFESLFLNYLLQNMRKTVPKTELFSGGFGEETYTSLMDQELSKVLAQRQDTGIARLLLQQLQRKTPVRNVK